MNHGTAVPGLLPLMKRRGLTQQDLARAGRLSVPTISALIAGQHKASTKTLGKLIRVLRLPNTYPLTRKGPYADTELDG